MTENEKDLAMTEKKKLPTIEEWFEENKSEEGYAGMTVGFKNYIHDRYDDAVNDALKGAFSGKIRMKDNAGKDFGILVGVTLDLVLSKDENGKIVYFIDESRVELV